MYSKLITRLVELLVSARQTATQVQERHIPHFFPHSIFKETFSIPNDPGHGNPHEMEILTTLKFSRHGNLQVMEILTAWKSQDILHLRLT
jgi:hypothetical protein